MTKSNDSNNILAEFGQCARGLIELLYQDQRLGMTEQLFIENHVYLIQSAFESWKRRNIT